MRETHNLGFRFASQIRPNTRPASQYREGQRADACRTLEHLGPPPALTFALGRSIFRLPPSNRNMSMNIQTIALRLPLAASQCGFGQTLVPTL